MTMYLPGIARADDDGAGVSVCVGMAESSLEQLGSANRPMRAAAPINVESRDMTVKERKEGS